MGGGTYHRWLRPNVPVPPKEVTPFPGAGPLSTSEQYPNDGFAQGILDDFEAAKRYARTLLQNCDCGSIKVRIVFAGFGDNYYDNAIKDALGVEPVKRLRPETQDAFEQILVARTQEKRLLVLDRFKLHGIAADNVG